MNRRRILVVAAAGLCAAVWTYACGDGATEPPPPPPDPPRPATVAVAPATVRLTALGATEELTAEVRDQNGTAMAGAAVSWASSAASVATVSATGLVTAAGNGTATITATAGSVSGTATVTVAQEVSAVAVTPALDTLVAGDTLRLTAVAADANGHPVAGAEFDWASGDTAVAVVDATGLVTGVGAGEAEVAATAAGVTGRAELSVVAPAPTSVAVTPDTVALTALGQTARLAAEVRDQNGRVIEGIPVSWTSADSLVAAVDSAGLVTAIGGGATTVAATAGEVSGAAVVTVMQSAGSVVLSPAADTVALGNTLRLMAEAFDENGHRVEGGSVHMVIERQLGGDSGRDRSDTRGLHRDGHDHGGGWECLRDFRNRGREPRPGGAGGALPCDGRAELGQQRELADQCEPLGMVRCGREDSREGRANRSRR